MKNILSILKKHVMTSISYLIPVVIAAGIMLAIGNIFGGTNVTDYSQSMNFFDLCTTLGALGISFIPMVISTGISFSIADKPGIAPGIFAGVLAGNMSTGFLGGLIGGFIAGAISKFMVKKIKVPVWFQGLMPTLFIPLISSIISCVFVYYIIGSPVIYITKVLTDFLAGLNTSSLILYGAIVGIMGGIDFGGPLNKITFAFCLGLQTEGFNEPITVVILANMIPALGFTISYFLSKIFKKEIYTNAEKETLKNAFAMGVFQITEGNLPIVLNDVIRALVAVAVGNGIGGALCMIFKCGATIPAGGLLAVPTMQNPFMFLLAVLIGAICMSVVYVLLKKEIVEDDKKKVEVELDLSKVKVNW